MDYIGHTINEIDRFIFGCLDGRMWWLHFGNMSESHCLFQPTNGYTFAARANYHQHHVLVALNTSLVSVPKRQEVWMVYVDGTGYRVLGALQPFFEPVTGIEGFSRFQRDKSRVVFVSQHGARRFEIGNRLQPSKPTIENAIKSCEGVVETIWLPFATRNQEPDAPAASSSRPSIFVVAVVVVVAVLLALLLLVTYRYRQSRNSVADVQLQLAAVMAEAHTQFAQQHPQLTAREGQDAALAWVMPQQLTLGSVLGQGAFGKVYAGVVKRDKTAPQAVAVKVVQNADVSQG